MTITNAIFTITGTVTKVSRTPNPSENPIITKIDLRDSEVKACMHVYNSRKKLIKVYLTGGQIVRLQNILGQCL